MGRAGEMKRKRSRRSKVRPMSHVRVVRRASTNMGTCICLTSGFSHGGIKGYGQCASVHSALD